VSDRDYVLRPEFVELMHVLQAAVDRARGLYPWPVPAPTPNVPPWAEGMDTRIVALEKHHILLRQALACAAEAGELAAAVAKNHGDDRITEEAVDVLVTAARVYLRA